MTPAARLRLAARLLYGGAQWVSAMANALGVDPRTVSRWLDGDMIPAPGVWDELAALLTARAAECSEAAAAITHDPPQQRRAQRSKGSGQF